MQVTASPFIHLTLIWPTIIIYRLIHVTAYLLLRVNCDKIMHARWDFDASSAQTRRVSALDKHQNWSASAFVTILEHKVNTQLHVLMCLECNCIKIMHARYFIRRILRTVNSDWLQYACSVRGVYEWLITLYIENKFSVLQKYCILWKVEFQWIFDFFALPPSSSHKTLTKPLGRFIFDLDAVAVHTNQCACALATHWSTLMPNAEHRVRQYSVLNSCCWHHIEHEIKFTFCPVFIIGYEKSLKIN